MLSLAQAVRRMTSLPAINIGVFQRGELREGYYADVVVFDPAQIRDNATFEDPHQYPVGIPLVVVGGRVTLMDGEHTGELAGRAVRAPGAPHLPASRGHGPLQVRQMGSRQ